MKKSILLFCGLVWLSSIAIASRPFSEFKVPFENNTLYAREYKGQEPCIILLHGFPDNHTLYDSLVEKLVDRHVIVFDFMGWGLSDKPKPKNYAYSDKQQSKEINAVVEFFKLQNVILAPHDMSGPAAINWALDHPEKSGGLIIFNTYYHKTKNRKIPFTGILLSTPGIRQFTLPFCVPNFLWNPVLKLSIKGFFVSKENRKAFMPGFIKQFAPYSAKRGFFKTIKITKLNAKQDILRLPEVKKYSKPVCIIFGKGDKFIGPGMAEEFNSLFSNSELHIIDESKHYPQIDSPQKVGDIIQKFSTKIK